MAPPPPEGASPWPTITYLKAWRTPAPPGTLHWQVRCASCGASEPAPARSEHDGLMLLLITRHARARADLGRGRFPIKHGRSPFKHGRVPIKHGHSPIKRRRFPIKHGRFSIEHGRFQPGANKATLEAMASSPASQYSYQANSVSAILLKFSNMCTTSWFKVAPSLCQDRSPSPTLAFLEALRAPVQSGAQQPWLVGSLVWRQQARPRQP